MGLMRRFNELGDDRMVEQSLVGVILLRKGINSTSDREDIVLDECIDILPRRDGVEEAIIDVEYFGTERVKVPSSVLDRMGDDKLRKATRMIKILPQVCILLARLAENIPSPVGFDIDRAIF